MLDSLDTKKLLIICSCIIILIILSRLLYNYYNKNNKNSLEGFENAIDLLHKLKSIDTQTTSDSSSADIELSINPWTTKLNNMQTTQQVKAIGLYKPHLVINGEKYVKLGDMVSLNTDYTPPSANEFTLLIKKIGSDWKAPVSYNLMVKFGNTNIPSFYYQYNNFFDSKNTISSIMTNFNNCVASISNLNLILQNNKNNITSTIQKIIKSQAYLKISTGNPISLNSLLNMPVNSLGNGLISTPVGASTPIILPLGTSATITTADNTYDINWSANFNINGGDTIANLVSQIDPNSPLQNFTTNNFTINSTAPINIFSLVNPNDIVSYLQNLCNDILTIYSQNYISQDLITYLKLADSSEGINSVLSAISTLQLNQNALPNLLSMKSNVINPLITNPSITNPSITNPSITNPVNIIASNSVLSAYANTNANTLLGGILNIIINKKQIYSYPCISFTPNNLTYNTNNTSAISVINGITNATGIIINNFNSSILDNITFSINNNSPEIANITSTVIPHLSQLYEFETALTNGNIDYFPLQIYEPVAPPNYTALGHVFCNTIKDFYKINTSNNVACVPSQCVREIREWQPSDKVFEYNKSGVYFALYKNPYTGTFISVNQPQMPSGKVCKVVACVAKCNAVDELIKADKCAREYQQINQSIINDTTHAPDLVSSTEENIYLQQIKQQSDNISKLKQRAQQMQVNIDKADIVNTEMNKNKLQDYVDTQKRNIDLVATQLEKDQNSIKTNLNIPIADINNLIAMIKQSSLDPQQKQVIVNSIIQNSTQLNKNIITKGQYTANLNKIMKSCPQYDLTGLVKKSVVSNVCYGCDTP